MDMAGRLSRSGYEREAPSDDLEIRAVRLRAYIKQEMNNPAHTRWVEDVKRQVAAGRFDKEPLDGEGLRALFKRRG